MTDFPDRDEWTDRPLRPPSQEGQCDACGKDGELGRVIVSGIETYACRKCRHADECDEAAEWDELGATDLIDETDLITPTGETK